VRLAAPATAAGAFSRLFGVGGGTIIVPLLVLWLGYERREATGTSLAAIAVIGALAAPALVVFAHSSQLEAVAGSLWPSCWWPSWEPGGSARTAA
jgi:uncharacterized membrane protein YfcA